MKRSNYRPFKETQVFDWESEPKDERPSEFVPSTGYSVLSGYYPEPGDARRGRHHRGRGGFNLVLWAGAASIGLGTVAMLGLIHWLRG